MSSDPESLEQRLPWYADYLPTGSLPQVLRWAIALVLWPVVLVLCLVGIALSIGVVLMVLVIVNALDSSHLEPVRRGAAMPESRRADG